MELARNDALACESGTPADGARPLPRMAAHVRTASRRWTGAETGGYHDGENDLAGKLEWSFRPGMLNPHAERLPGITARLVTFTIRTETRSGRAKTTQMRVLTTLLDHEAFPARGIAALYAERWQVGGILPSPAPKARPRLIVDLYHRQKKLDIHDNHSWLLGDSAGYPVVGMRGRGG
jgi:hypothetical protein